MSDSNLALSPAETRSDAPDDAHPPALSVLVARQVEEMAAAWDRGERPRAEDFLARNPDLRAEDAIRIVFEEACLRQEAGEQAVTAEIFRRFPQWRQQLGVLLDCNRLLRNAPRIDFPKPGESLGDFDLLVEIGRGALGRTFLASQRSLADRPIVLKVTPLDREEHLSLARLQHMHIVPLYFEQVFAERNLRVLGMPYLGGTTLDRVLSLAAAVPAKQRTGSLILDAVDRGTRALPAEYPANGPFRKYLARESYNRSVCWLGVCLADALQYAHDRGLVHLDIKPSNVLIAADGQPMLLDFHLARAPVAKGDPAPEHLGGTPGYLSPEQQAAMDAVRRGGVVTSAIDGRSDLYSLGKLLQHAFDPSVASPDHATTTHARDPEMTPGLFAIIDKCLARDPADRYADAASLALDLRRHLDDLPLRGVPNRSPLERWHKWRRRSPGALGRWMVKGVAILGLLIGAGVAVAQLRQTEKQIETSLSDGRRLLRRRQYADARLVFQRGLALAHNLPGHREQKRLLAANLQRVRWAQAAKELNEVVDLLRFQFGVAPPSSEEAAALFERGRALWNARGRLNAPAHDSHDLRTARQVRTDLIDLATILADLRAHQTSPAGDKSALEDAVTLLREAEHEVGASPALTRDLHTYTKALGKAEAPAPAAPPPQTAWEHYDLGRSYLRSREYALAEQQFRRSVDLQPVNFWPQYYLGLTAYRVGHFHDATAAFSAAIALSPQTPECYYNRALARAALGEIDEAVRDHSHALAVNPDFTNASLNRGGLYLQSGKHTAALTDFQHALETARTARARSLIEYNIALVHVARHDWPAAKSCLKRASDAGLDEAKELYRTIETR